MILSQRRASGARMFSMRQTGFALDFITVKRYNTTIVLVERINAMDITRHEALDQLYQAILSLKTVEECYEFFEGCLHNQRAAGDIPAF